MEGEFPSGTPSHEVASRALEEDHKKQKQEMTREVLEGFSRFICLGCIFLKSLNVFYNEGLTFSIT